MMINGKQTKDDEKICTSQRKDGEEQQGQADHHLGSSASISTNCKKRKYSNIKKEEKEEDDHDKKKKDLTLGPNKIEMKNEAAEMSNENNTAMTTTKVTIKRQSGSFLGRRGDPRMHRAVAARLARPELSLFQALVIGGFKFPNHINEVSVKYSNEPVYDSDSILLSQRKNQLSRRLRHIRQRRQKKEDSQNAQPTNFQGLRQMLLTDQSPVGIDSNNFSVFGTHRGLLQEDVPNQNHSLLQNRHVRNPVQEQQQLIQLLRTRDIANQHLLMQEQLSLYTSLDQPSRLIPNNATDPLFHSNAGRFLANNLVPMSVTSSGMTHQVSSPVPIGNSQDFTHISRMESAVSWYENQKNELKRRALVAAGFRENEIDELLLVLHRNPL